MKKGIVPVVCVAKTGSKVKEFWTAGLSKDEAEKLLAVNAGKLNYKYLSGLENTDTGTEIKNIIHEAASKIAAVYERVLANKGELLENHLESVSQWDTRSTNLMFSKTVLADAIRARSGLTFPEVVTTSDDGEAEVSDVIEL